MSTADDDFSLSDLSDERLDVILSLKEEQAQKYIDELIKKYYPNITIDENQLMYEKLQIAYYSSFMVEKLYRNNDLFKVGFTPNYTSTGIIINITNDLYLNKDEFVIH